MRDRRPGTAARSVRPSVLFTIAALVASAAVAACGSSPQSAASSSYAQGVKYADCMRSHEVPNFPDPSTGGGVSLRTSNVNQASPAYVSASKACANLRPGGPAKPAAITPGQRAAMFAWARCIREHGVPDFADPRFGSGGQGVETNIPPHWNPEAPAVINATRTCAHVGIALQLPGVAPGG